MKRHIYRFYFFSSLIVLHLICSIAAAQQPMVKIALMAPNGQYVCADGGGGRKLVANQPAPGPWETFTLIDLPGGASALRAANGQYVSAEDGGGRELVANRNNIGAWETFRRIDRGNRKVALQAANGQYVSADGGGGKDVFANGPAIGLWENFELVILKILAAKIDEAAQPGSPFSSDDSPKPWIKTATTDWMAFVADTTPLRSISIPGTHDSGALHGGLAAQTQALSIKDQLEAGIRFLDIRTRRTKDSLAIHHGMVYQKQMFGDVMEAVSGFLKSHPTEAIVMHIRADEHTAEEGSEEFATIWAGYMKRYGNLFARITDSNVTLGRVRGKVFVLKDGWQDPSIGISYFDRIFDKQAHWKVFLLPGDGISDSETAHLDGKKKKINEFIDRAGSSSDWVMNFLSGAVGMAPKDVAYSTNYSAYKHIGPHAYNKVLGTVVMDFPGEQLIYRIIKSNFASTCAPRTFRSNSQHTWVEFRLREGSEGQTIKIPGGAYNKYVFPKCNRVWWTSLTFSCKPDGSWQKTSGDWDADAWCHGYKGTSPYVFTGDQ